MVYCLFHAENNYNNLDNFFTQFIREKRKIATEGTLRECRRKVCRKKLYGINVCEFL